MFSSRHIRISRKHKTGSGLVMTDVSVSETTLGTPAGPPVDGPSGAEARSLRWG